MKMICIIMILFYCSCKPENTAVHKSFKQIISDSLRFKAVQNNADLLNFSTIDKGSDSFELRLWSFLAMTDLTFVTILKFSKSRWSLTETTYWVDYITDNQNRTIKMLDSSITKRKRPAIAFSNIIDSINNFQINTLQSQHEIPGFVNRTADGISYVLEISTKDYYKIISYDNPKYYEDLMHKRIIEILSFLKINLGAFVEN